MKPTVRNRYWKIFCLLIVLSMIPWFQNCNSISFENLEAPSVVFSAGNGNTYDGKLMGRYVRRVPGYKCHNVQSIHSSIEVNPSSIVHMDECSKKQTIVSRSQIKNSPYLNTVIGYEGSIYERDNTKKYSLYNESFCRYEKSPLEGYAVVVQWNRSDRTLATIHKGFKGPSGQPYKQAWGPVLASRKETKTNLNYNHNNFKLKVDLTAPVSNEFRLFKSQFQVTIDGTTEKHAMECFLGAEQDIAFSPLTVAALYPSSGSDWGKWIQADGGSIGKLGHTDSPCVNMLNGAAYVCHHGGEMRAVELSGFSSCSGLLLEDDLNAFDWVCDESGTTPRFYSQSLSEDSSLTHLIHPEGFKYNRVRLKSKESGILLGASPLFQWWSNPIVPLPGNSQSSDSFLNLSGAGNIYYLDQDRESMGYALTDPGISIVVFPGAKLKAHKDLMVRNAGNLQALNLLRTTSMFGWIEGQFIGTNDLRSIISVSSHFNRIHNSSFDTCGSALACVYLVWSEWNNFTNVEVKNSGGDGIELNSFARRNFFKNVKTHGHAGHGIDFETFSGGNPGEGNRLVNFTSVNNGADGVNVGNNDGDGNIFINLLSANNGRYGAEVGYYNNTFVNSVFANNGSHGVRLLRKCLECRFFNVTSIDNAGHGFHSDLGTSLGMELRSNNQFVNVASINNDIGFHVAHSTVIFNNILSAHNNIGTKIFDVSNNNLWSGVHYIGSNPQNCSVTSTGLAPGINNLCQNVDGSNANLVTGVNVLNDFVSPPNSCSVGLCQLADWALSKRSHSMMESNGVVTSGSLCPTSAHGNEELSFDFSSTLSFHYLKYAYEIVDDEIGNENGLCESNEACVFSPNIGAYQGHGDYRQTTCQFQDGMNVKGVTLYAHPSNGF